MTKRISFMINVDVFCPLYNAENYISGLIKGIRSQKNVQINKIIFGITESTDKTLDLICKLNDVDYFIVKKEEFSHSSVRNEGIRKCISNVVILLTQDVVLFDENAFFNIASKINDSIVYAFGKQISKFKGIEKHIREINYPNKSYVMGKKDIDKYQLMTFFASDAFAAYNREIFIRVNGYDDKKLMMSEDMYYSHKIILLGYKTAYVSEAVVEHSHNFKLKELYKRYYDTGNFFKENPEFSKYKATESGLKLAIKVFIRIIKTFDLYSLIIFIPNMMARFLGKKKGQK